MSARARWLLAALLASCGAQGPRTGPHPWDLVTLGPDAALPAGAVRGDGDELELDAGASATFWIELPRGGELHLRGRAGGPGLLRASCAALSPADGATRALAAEPWEETVHGAFERVVRLADPGGDVLALELRWSETAEPLTLHTLELRETAPARRPPIVLVSIDTLAARHLSLYGYPRATTPHLDRFAEEAAVFEACDANAAWTTPSYMSQLTGQSSSTFWSDLSDELFGDLEWSHYYLSDPHWTLAEMLRARGYRTAAFVDNLKIGAHLGLDQGFEVYDTSAAELSYDVVGGGVHHVVRRALAWLDGLENDAPVFLFVQALDVHAPYLPYEPWAGRFQGDEHATEGDGLVSHRRNGVWGAVPRYVARPLFEPDAELPERIALAPIVAAYDEEILATDKAFGHLLDELAERGLGDAVVVFSADHGEAMLEHDAWFSHHTVYQDTIHVPLVLRAAGSPRRGSARPAARAAPGSVPDAGRARRRAGRARPLARALRSCRTCAASRSSPPSCTRSAGCSRRAA